jgi:hypothetical protein
LSYTVWTDQRLEIMNYILKVIKYSFILINIIYCYIVSVKVQFFCFPIGQKRIMCRSAKRYVHYCPGNEVVSSLKR